MQFEWDKQKAATNLTKHGESGKILVVAHTDDGHTVRIISAREATYGERQFYEEG